MANLALSDLLAAVRFFLSEPSTQGRFPDPELTTYINMACVQTMIRVEWPEATYSLTSDGVHREYPLPELYALLRVYVAGQECVPTTIPLLEGDALQIYDNSGTNQVPQWTQAPFTGYPVASGVSMPNSNALPYFTGQRPSYYTRNSGILGILPPPTAGWNVAIDVYPAPPTLVNPGDLTFFPQLFKEAIAWQAMTYAFFAENDQGANQTMQICAAQFEKQATILTAWKSKFVRNLPNQPMPMPHRMYFQGPPRGPRGSSSRFGG